jgi:NAD(P)-dependent dehydrogenase (short-subunit alcohol dehydrogenase family)
MQNPIPVPTPAPGKLRGFDLTGRRAIVFGGRSARGKAIADAFREAGAAVGVTVSRPDEEGTPADLARAEEADAAVARLVGELGGLDVAVFVPEVWVAGPISDPGAGQAARDAITGNLVAAYNAFRGAAAAMSGRTETGRLIAVVSGAALRGLANFSASAAAEAGIVGLVRALSQELGAQGITANVIVAGWMSDTPGRGPERVEENLLLRFIPMRRFGAPEELAPLAVYLASEASGYVNGHVMAVDGGALKHL